MVYIVWNVYTSRIYEVFSTRKAAEDYCRDNDSEFSEMGILEKVVK